MKRRNLLFTVMTALFLLASTSFWAAQSGKCGDNVTWTLDGGVLTIESTGAMSDYSEATPLGNLSFTSVVIKDGVTRIGNYAFMYCTGLTKIESLAETPPACGDDAFSGVDKNSCELYVPEKSIKAYNDAEVWQDFFNIAAGISGVAQESNVGVSASNGTITVTGAAAGTVVEVYNANGTQVYRGTGNTVNVPSAGMYIVRAAGKTFKVNTARYTADIHRNK